MPYAIDIKKVTGFPRVQFTPAYYQKAVKAFRNGSYGLVIEMMSQAALDSHVAGCIGGRQAGYKQEHVVTPYDETDKDRDRAAWLQDEVFDKLRFRDLMDDIHEARLFKFSVIDFDWDIVSGLRAPVEHEKYEHKYFAYDPDDGILKTVNGLKYEEIPETVMVCETRKTPVLIPVTRDYILKVHGLESWASFIERFGEPFILGYYPPGCEKEIKDELYTAVKAIARSGAGIAPDQRDGAGNKMIEMLETHRTTGDHKDYKEACDKGIAISILGHANAVEQGQGMQVGENLGQYKVRRDIAVDDMFFNEQYINKLIRMIYDLNWTDARYPKITFDKKEPKSQKDLLDAVDMFHRHGGTVPVENYTRLGVIVEDDQESLSKQPSALEY